MHHLHDKLVKSTFSDPDKARAFLRAHLPSKSPALSKKASGRVIFLRASLAPQRGFRQSPL